MIHWCNDETAALLAIFPVIAAGLRTVWVRLKTHRAHVAQYLGWARTNVRERQEQERRRP